MDNTKIIIIIIINNHQLQYNYVNYPHNINITVQEHGQDETLKDNPKKSSQEDLI